MTAISTTDDFLELLDENPDFLDAARHKILTGELLALPAMFSGFATETRTKLDTLETDAGVLKGIVPEARLADRGLAQIARTFSLRMLRTVRPSGHSRASARFDEAIREAPDSSVIHNGEYQRLLDADLIAQGSASGGDVAFCAGGASLAADDYVDQVSTSAGILRKVFPGVETCAALYCVEAAEDVEALAERQGVALIIGRLP